MNKILIIDDEPAIVRLVKSYLEAEGFEVHSATEGISGLKSARLNKPDLVVLDIMLPGMDGLEVLSHLREESDVYVILLTAKTEEMDKVIGLSVGADDYVSKPFSPRELTARVKAAMRRMQGAQESPKEPTRMTFAHISIDLYAHQVFVNGNPVDLTTIEFDLLVALAENRGRVMTRERLMEKVWNYDYFGETRVVDVHMGHLRQKLGIESLISTVRGVGYRLEDEPL